MTFRVTSQNKLRWKIKRQKRFILQSQTKSGVNATKTFESFLKAYGDEYIAGSQAVKWYKRCREAPESVQNDEREP